MYISNYKDYNNSKRYKIIETHNQPNAPAAAPPLHTSQRVRNTACNVKHNPEA